MVYDTISLPGSGLVFNNVYSFDTSLYPGYKSAIIDAEHFFQNHFTNSVQLNINFTLGSLGSGTAASNNLAVGVVDPVVTYNTLVSALQSFEPSPLLFPADPS